jgi:RNA polymerase sigma-70 factor, ECF subfamily
MSLGLHPRVLVTSNIIGMEEIRDVSDAQLVAFIAGSSELALAEAYWRHGGAVCGLARQVMNNSAEAEDITQDIFLRLWNRPKSFDPARGTLRSFLLAQSHSRAIDAVRSRSARTMREAKDSGRSRSSIYDVQYEVWDLVLTDQIGQALEQLSSEERRAIELAFFEEYSYVAVAQMLEQPEGTVKSRIRNGMRKMRAILLDAGIDGPGS